MFCGKLRQNEKQQTASHYDTELWLVDIETHFSRMTTLTDKEEIAEAVKGTNPQVGNVHIVCTGSDMAKIHTHDEFKNAMRRIYTEGEML